MDPTIVKQDNGSAMLRTGGMDRTIVYMDEGYIAKARDLLKKEGKSLNVVRLAHGVAASQGLVCARAYYYTTPPYESRFPTNRELANSVGYRQFKERLLKKAPEFTFREGILQKTGAGFRQKGVDTLITIDLMEEPFEEEGVNAVILITGDSDFVPIIERLRQRGICVIVACFYGGLSGFSVSRHLAGSADKVIMLNLDGAAEAQLHASLEMKS